MFLKTILISVSCLIVSSKLIVDNSDYSIWTIPDDVSGDVTTITTTGTGLIGGGSDCVPAFDWQISNANRGDFVILRASGTDAYNPFVYDLSVEANKTLNSVTTIVFKNRQASYDKTVQSLLSNAEAIFFAGGDQGNYIDFWAGTPIQTIAQEKVKTVTISGTSAGLAILGNWIYR
jgi:cyanophycinase